jgi:hypothetical protein
VLAKERIIPILNAMHVFPESLSGRKQTTAASIPCLPLKPIGDACSASAPNGYSEKLLAGGQCPVPTVPPWPLQTVEHGSGHGEGAYGVGTECTGDGEGGDDAVVAAGWADGSDDAEEAVMARPRASRSVHDTGAASRSIQGASSDVGKHHVALAVAAGAPTRMGTTASLAAGAPTRTLDRDCA